MMLPSAILILLLVAVTQMDVLAQSNQSTIPATPTRLQHPHRHDHEAMARRSHSHEEKSLTSNEDSQLLTAESTISPQAPSSNRHEKDFNGKAQMEMMVHATEGDLPKSEACNSFNGNTQSCRIGRRCLPAPLYALEACARCYSYIPARNFVEKLKTRVLPFSSVHGVYNITFLYNGTHEVSGDPDSEDEMVLNSFRTGVHLWTSCCRAAVKCCQEMASIESPSPDGTCPRTWDGWQCWPDTAAGTVARQDCPDYIYYFTQPPSCPRKALKHCTASGSWYVSRGGAEWSNYSTCSTLGLLQERVKVHLAAHFVSIISLVPALAIYFSYKQLRVPRVVMHKNLFISLLSNSTVVMAFLSTVVLRDDREDHIQSNTAGCVILLLLTKFFRLASYMWMFCEAFYLHKLVASAFAEQRSLFIYYFMGWVFPVNPVILYASFRAYHANDQCWIVPADPYEWILNVPCFVALLLNVIFMINILRVLVTKLRAANTHEPGQYRKAVRATLVLIPLFGLHFLITLYRPSSVACRATEFYHHLNSCVDGLQGLLVSLAFCYLNGEVQQLIRRSYRRWLDRREPRRGYHRPSQSMVLGRSSATLLNTTFTSMECPRYSEDGFVCLEPRGMTGKTLNTHEEESEQSTMGGAEGDPDPECDENPSDESMNRDNIDEEGVRRTL